MTPFDSFNTTIANVKIPVIEGPTPKMLFICGTPRSGTTILYQSLSYCGEVGYIDNLIARFASNPSLGVLLSRALDLPKEFTGKSEFGLTEGLTEPHEFGLGWSNLLSPSGVVQPLPDTRLDQGSLSKLQQLAKSFDRPTVFKSFAYLWYLTEIASTFPEARFVHITRDISQTAASLEKLYHRRAEGGTPLLWTSAVMQKTMIEGAFLNLSDRCHMQIKHIDTHIRNFFASLDTDHKLTISLNDYSAEPRDTVQQVFNHFDIPFDRARTEILR